MHKYYRHIVVALSLACLLGCQASTGENLFVSQPSRDATITTAVLEAMLTNENTSTITVHVETTNGVVLLSGYVKTIRQSDTSEDVARKTPGVKSVQNNIIVRK